MTVEATRGKPWSTSLLLQILVPGSATLLCLECSDYFCSMWALIQVIRHFFFAASLALSQDSALHLHSAACSKPSDCELDGECTLAVL
jgi:hypothetical protein